MRSHERLRRACRCLFILLLLVTLSPGASTDADAAGPRYIPFQGRLTNADGSAIPDTTVNVLFSIYDVASGGTAKWTETHTNVPVQGGQINLTLGTIRSLDDPDQNPGTSDALDFATNTYHLGITVGGQGNQEMAPRQQLLPSFHSRIADEALVARAVQANVVSGTAIQSNSISTAKIVDGEVKAVDLGTDAVETAKIKDGNVTATKLGSDVRSALAPLEIHAKVIRNGTPGLAAQPGVFIPFALPDTGLSVQRGSAKLPCVSGQQPGAAGADSCGSGDGTVGVVFNVTRPGGYEVCVDFASPIAVHSQNNRVDITVNYRLAETPLDSYAELQSGDVKAQALFERALNSPESVVGKEETINFCQFFNLTAGEKAIRLFRRYDGVQINLAPGSCCVGCTCAVTPTYPFTFRIREIP